MPDNRRSVATARPVTDNLHFIPVHNSNRSVHTISLAQTTCNLMYGMWHGAAHRTYPNFDRLVDGIGKEPLQEDGAGLISTLIEQQVRPHIEQQYEGIGRVHEADIIAIVHVLALRFQLEVS
eukprot:14148-Heterococcus_DN1.PRE.2